MLPPITWTEDSEEHIARHDVEPREMEFVLHGAVTSPDSAATPAAENPHGTDATGIDLPDFDPALGDLVDLVDALGTVEIAVTLHASGTVVSGLLISGRHYFELLIAGLNDSSNAEIGRALGQWFQPWVEMYREDERAPREDHQPSRPVSERVGKVAGRIA